MRPQQYVLVNTKEYLNEVGIIEQQIDTHTFAVCVASVDQHTCDLRRQSLTPLKRRQRRAYLDCADPQDARPAGARTTRAATLAKLVTTP